MPIIPGFFYRTKPTKNAYGGIGTGNEAFEYPFMFPAQPTGGPGNLNAGQLRTVGPDQMLYEKRVTNAPASGYGDLAGSIQFTELLQNLYTGQNNTVKL